MVHTFPMGSTYVGDTAIRALSSLTRRDADAVRATVRAVASCHTVQEHDDYDGYRSLLVVPLVSTRPSFMVSGRTGAVDLAELWEDEMTAIGTFASIGAAMIVLKPALERTEALDATRVAAQATALRARHGDHASIHAALRADGQPAHPKWASILRAIDDGEEPS